MSAKKQLIVPPSRRGKVPADRGQKPSATGGHSTWTELPKFKSRGYLARRLGMKPERLQELSEKGLLPKLYDIGGRLKGVESEFIDSLQQRYQGSPLLDREREALELAAERSALEQQPSDDDL